MLWHVVNKKTNETVIVDRTRREAYESKHSLETVLGGHYVVRKVK